MLFNKSKKFSIYGVTTLKLNAYGANYSLTDLAQEVNIEKEFVWYNKEYYDEFVRTKLLEGLEDKKDDK